MRRQRFAELAVMSALALAAAQSGEVLAGERAGVGGVPADTRWVAGTGVVLRAEAAAESPALARLGLNRPVRLQAPEGADGWCAVTTAAGERGWIACRWLSAEPVDLAAIANPYDSEGRANPQYDPARLFRMQPGWPALSAYAQQLAERHRSADGSESWPRDEELERMKAELAKGTLGPRPAPLPDWQALRAAAVATVDGDVSWEFGLWGGPFAYGDSDDATGDAGHLSRQRGALRAMQPPAARPSLFRDEAAVAPPEPAEALSGRFGIVHRNLFSARPAWNPDDPDFDFAGFYDMQTRTQALVRSVTRVTLFADGRVQAAASVARSRERLWGDRDVMCPDWEAGFAHGDSDPAIWTYLYGDDAAAAAQERARIGRAPGSLYALYVPATLPAGAAGFARAELALDRDATGFVRATTYTWDFDRDGIADVFVWEGTGHGPGHMDAGTTTDDTWYRLVLANIGGRWKLLGTDQFGYGCGC